MEGRINENNIVTLSGKITSNFTFSHEVFGEGFYKADLSVKRESGTVDIIPIMVSDRLIDTGSDWKDRIVRVEGQFRSHIKKEYDKNKLDLYVFTKWLEETEEMPFYEDENHISISGVISKQPVYRKTPLGREITDLFIAVNRPYRKSDYIPCLCWGRNARFASNFELGTKISIEGRVQSREYKKYISDDEYEIKTAYEVSASKVELKADDES